MNGFNFIFEALKRAISILLIATILVQLGNKLVVVALFNLNQQKIISLFCENKSVPKSTCNGKCFLNKKLKQTDDTENSQTRYPIKQKVSEEVILFCDQIVSVNISGISTVTHVANIKNRRFQQVSFSIFQPPRG